jgi:hypothetical protein
MLQRDAIPNKSNYIGIGKPLYILGILHYFIRCRPESIEHASGSQCRQFGYHGTIRNDRLADRRWSHGANRAARELSTRLEATTDQQYMVQRHGSLLADFQKLCHRRSPKGLSLAWSTSKRGRLIVAFKLLSSAGPTEVKSTSATDAVKRFDGLGICLL